MPDRSELEALLGRVMLGVLVGLFIGFVLGIGDGINIAQETEKYCATIGCLP